MELYLPLCVCTKRVCVKFTELAFSCLTSAISFPFIPAPCKQFLSYSRRRITSSYYTQIQPAYKHSHQFLRQDQLTFAFLQPFTCKFQHNKALVVSFVFLRSNWQTFPRQKSLYCLFVQSAVSSSCKYFVTIFRLSIIRIIVFLQSFSLDKGTLLLLWPTKFLLSGYNPYFFLIFFYHNIQIIGRMFSLPLDVMFSEPLI